MGIIGKPYIKNGDEYKYDPKIYFGFSEIEKIYYCKQEDISDKVIIPYEV